MCLQRHSKIYFQLLRDFPVAENPCTAVGRIIFRSQIISKFFNQRLDNERIIKLKQENKMKKNRKNGRNPVLNPNTHCVMVRFDDVEWNKFLTMYEESQLYAKAVFLKAHFFGQKFKVLKVDKAMLEYCTRLSDFHAQFRGIGTNYNQVVKELRSHFSEKKAMTLLYRLEKQTIDLVKLSREIVELSREMYAKWEQINRV